MIAAEKEDPKTEAMSRHIATDGLQENDADFPYGIYDRKLQTMKRHKQQLGRL
jgi:hypothetical protein